jgi:hypothetical protein
VVYNSWCSYIYEGAQNGSATNILDPVGRVVSHPVLISIPPSHPSAGRGLHVCHLSLLGMHGRAQCAVLTLHSTSTWHHFGNLSSKTPDAVFLTIREIGQARTAQPERKILSLSDYRTRHNQYNTDVGERSSTAAASIYAREHPLNVAIGSKIAEIVAGFADTKRMRASAPLIPVWDDHE